MLKHIIKKNNKGFTLIELIVVLVILGILLAVTVPAVFQYIDDAKEVRDDIKISYLNKASQGYKVRLYADDTLGSDIFAGITTEQERQQALVDAGLIDDLQTSYKDDKNYFYWDISEQIWKKVPGTGGGDTGGGDTGGGDTGGGDEKPTEQLPIRGVMPGNLLSEQVVADGIDVDTVALYNELFSFTYKIGDYVKNDGKIYKKITDGAGGKPSINSRNIWKIMSPDSYFFNNWKQGDLVFHEGQYYMALWKSADDNNIYSREHKADITTHEGFVKIKKVNGFWVEAN